MEALWKKDCGGKSGNWKSNPAAAVVVEVRDDGGLNCRSSYGRKCTGPPVYAPLTEFYDLMYFPFF